MFVLLYVTLKTKQLYLGFMVHFLISASQRLWELKAVRMRPLNQRAFLSVTSVSKFC